MKKIIVLISTLFLFGCIEKEDEILPQKNYTISIDSVLNQIGTKSLEIDKNGYYHLKLLPIPKQQVYRITGKVLSNGKEPNIPLYIDWESNLFWYIREGESIFNIAKSYINYYTGQFTIVSLPPLVSNKTEIVPTINKTSVSGTGGRINTMIAPIGSMIGDTMIVKAYNSEQNIRTFAKIVLE